MPVGDQRCLCSVGATDGGGVELAVQTSCQIEDQ